MKPTFKNEIIVEECPNPAALSIEVATKRALEWVIKEAPAFTSDSTLINILKGKVAPTSATLLVSPCFDTQEVKEYLGKPVYEKNDPLTLIKS